MCRGGAATGYRAGKANVLRENEALSENAGRLNSCSLGRYGRDGREARRAGVV